MCGYILRILFDVALLGSLRFLVLLARIFPATFFQGFGLGLVYEVAFIRFADVHLRPFQRLLVKLDVVLVSV